MQTIAMALPTRRGWLLVLVLATACSAAPVAEQSIEPSASPTARPSSTRTAEPIFVPRGDVDRARVVDVVDGDTIKVDIQGTVYTIRYIGIDTPETVDPNSPVMWMGPEASAANAALVEGEDVYLEKDVSETDRFGRLLRYVWLDDPSGWILVNLELVRQGFAVSSAYPPDVEYQDLFDAAEILARTADRGLWGPTPTPAPTVAPTPTPPPAPPPPAGNCDASYPTVCIPPPPPDLDCGDISFRRFQVLPPDPHGFDGNHDGVGCESG